MKTKFYQLACLMAALTIGITAFAQDSEPAGTWDIEVDMGGTTMQATLVVTKNSDGSYAGSLNSLMGDLEVESVEYNGGEKLSFNETIGEGDAAVEFKFEGNFTGPDTFEGELTMQLGILPVIGTRAKDAPAIVGVWDVVSDSQLGVLERVLTINKDWSGSYASDEDSWEISDLSVEGDAVVFQVTLEAQDQEVPLEFKGTYAGKELTGNLFMDGSSASDVTGVKRVPGGIEVLVGEWEMVSEDTPIGVVAGKMVVNADGTAKFIWADGEAAVEEFKVDAEFVTFSVNVLHEGGEYFVDFEGEITSEEALEGDYLLDGSPVGTVKGSKN